MRRRSSRSGPTTSCRRRGRTGQPSAPLERRSAVPRRESARFAAAQWRGRKRAGIKLILVRLFLFLALAAIGASVLLWLVKRDARYLRFIALTLKFAVLMLLAILLWFAAERLLAPVVGTLI